MTSAGRRLPGLQPLDMQEWLIQDEVFAAQMALRDQLLLERRAEVFHGPSVADAAAEELLALLLAHLGDGYSPGADKVTRPDGVTVDLRADHPLLTAGRLVQEDFCILQRPDGADEHVLTAAVLCFPASWTLAEKIGRPLTGVHEPVVEYSPDMARRVERLFAHLQPDRPMWRANALRYRDPSLFHPRSEDAPHHFGYGETSYLRSERQSMVKLPKSGAAVFSIHTWVVLWATLSLDQQDGLDSYLAETAGQGT